MTFISSQPATKHPPQGPTHITKGWRYFLLNIKKWSARRGAHRSLSGLSDHHLRDIGLTRADCDNLKLRGVSNEALAHRRRGRNW